MKSYVIKRDDGLYLSRNRNIDARRSPTCVRCFTGIIANAEIYRGYDNAEFVKDGLADWDICKVVPVEIKECEDE